MDDKDPILEHPGSHEMAVHVRDYERFISRLKVGTILVALTVAFAIWLIV